MFGGNMENKLKISKRLVILLIISLIMPVTILADTVAFKTVVSKNDMAVSGDFWLDLQMQITAGTSPRTLNSFTADIYYTSTISYNGPGECDWAFSVLNGYTDLTAADLSGHVRLGCTGGNVGAIPGWDGWDVTTSWQTVVTLKFTIATATSVDISIDDATNDAAYFNNIANNPPGAGADDWAVTTEDGGDITLPVELSSFTVQYINDIPTLYWTTQSETNNAGWNIYRGETNEALSNEETYQLNLSLGLIPGSGTTSEPTDYCFEDVFPIYQGTTYFYWLESVDYSGDTEIYGPISLTIPENEWQNPNSPEIPKPYGLHQNYPNPFNPHTEISFMMKENCIAELSIYNLKGQKIKTLFKNRAISRDELIISNWNGKDESGKEVTSGIYFYKLMTTKGNYVRKMILLK